MRWVAEQYVLKVKQIKEKKMKRGRKGINTSRSVSNCVKAVLNSYHDQNQTIVCNKLIYFKVTQI